MLQKGLRSLGVHSGPAFRRGDRDRRPTLSRRCRRLSLSWAMPQVLHARKAGPEGLTDLAAGEE